MNRLLLLASIFVGFVLIVSIKSSSLEFSFNSEHSSSNERPHTNNFEDNADNHSLAKRNYWHHDTNSLGKRLLVLTNQARSTGRKCGNTYYRVARPLSWNSDLGEAATSYAKHLYNTKSRLRHSSNYGDSCMEAGENLHHGSQSPEAVIAAWLRSPNHCANLMNDRYDRFGSGNAGTYWVQHFGRNCD
jgi:uncharacterized protein YkwD